MHGHSLKKLVYGTTVDYTKLSKLINMSNKKLAKQVDKNFSENIICNTIGDDLQIPKKHIFKKVEILVSLSLSKNSDTS